MKPITSEEDRQERIAQVKRQLGSPKTSPQKRKELNRLLSKLNTYELEAGNSFTQSTGANSTWTTYKN